MGPRSDTPTSCSAAGKTCRRGAASARSGGPPVLAPIVNGDGVSTRPFDRRGVALTMGPRSDTPTSCSAAGKTCRRGAASARSGGPPVLAPIVTGDDAPEMDLRAPRRRCSGGGAAAGARIARRRVPRPQCFCAPSTTFAGPRGGPTGPAAAERERHAPSHALPSPVRASRGLQCLGCVLRGPRLTASRVSESGTRAAATSTEAIADGRGRRSLQ